jgi:hypothetical protein
MRKKKSKNHLANGKKKLRNKERIKELEVK